MKPTISIFNYAYKNQGSGTLDIFIDGGIVDAETQDFYREYWGDETSVSFKSFRDQILAANPSTINLRVNCTGGHVGDALAMYDFLQEQEGNGVTVNRVGTGIVASAGTYLVLGGSLTKNTMWMIHEVISFAYGSATQLENQAKATRKFNDKIVDLYCSTTGMNSNKMGDLMKDETWMNADEAKEYGFVKEVVGAETTTNSNSLKPINKDHWPFKNIAILNAYNSSISQPPHMKFDTKNIGTSLKNALSGVFNIGKSNELKPTELTAEELLNLVTDTVNNSLTAMETPIQEQIDSCVSTGIDNALKGEAFTNAVSAALNKHLEKIPANITQAITDSTKGFVTNDKFTKLETDIANKIGIGGNAGNKKNDNKKNEDDKSVFNMEGVSIE